MPAGWNGLQERPIVDADLLFNVEDHLFPTLPWYRLRGARDMVRPALGAGYHQSRSIHWMLDRRRRPAEAVFLGIPVLQPGLESARADAPGGGPRTP